MSAKEPPEPVAAHKRALRRRFGERRKGVSREASLAASRAAAGHVGGLEAFASAEVVALYSPIRGEIDPLCWAELPEAADKRFVFPRTHVETRALTFHPPTLDPGPILGRPGCAAQIRDAMTPGPYGILEPVGHQIPLGDIDLVVVPALAYDRRGHRLGYGGGFYDRCLEALAEARGDDVMAVGLGYG